MPDDPGTQLIQIHFAGGLKQKTQNEWLDPSQGQTSIVNGSFTYDGSVSKRLGAKLVANSTLAGGSTAIGTLSQGIRTTPWSKGVLAVAGLDTQNNGGLYTVGAPPEELPSWMVGVGPLPTCKAVRRGIPVLTGIPAATSGIVPVVIDAEVGSFTYRYIFYTTASATWAVILDANTGNLLVSPTQVYASSVTSIVGHFLPAAGVVVVLLQQLTGSNTMLGLTFNQGSLQPVSATSGLGVSSIVTADMCPAVNDPAGGSYLLYQSTSGQWAWWYFTVTAGTGAWNIVHLAPLETTAATHSTCQISCTHSSGTQTAYFLYCYGTGSTPISSTVRFASILGYSTLLAPITLATVSANSPVYVSGCSISQQINRVFCQWFQVTNSLSFGTSIGTTQYVNGATGAVYHVGALPLGFWPVGRPVLVNNAIYQPCITQLGTSLVNQSPGSSEVQSEQCTLYMMQFNYSFSLPVATVAPRQVDPLFSYQFLNAPCGALPASSFTGATLSVGLRTIGEDIPAVGYPTGGAWYADFFFDSNSQSLLYQSNEISGALRLSCGVPMVSDGTQTAEDGFFYYPEFADAALATTGTTSLNGTYSYAVCYVYVDATGQIQRSAPVFTNAQAVSNTGTPPVVNFFPLSASYRNVEYPGSVFAEIYRTVAGGGTFYLASIVPAFGSVNSSAPLGAVTPSTVGSGYSSTPSVTLSGGGGSGATVSAVLGGGAVSAVNVVSTGTQYNTPPTVTFSGGGGAGAAATAILGPLGGGDGFNYGVMSFKVTAGGSGYSSAPTVTLSGGGGSGATATSTITQRGVFSYNVVTSGSGYTSAPTVTVSGGGGSGATATAVLATSSSTVTNIQYVDSVTDAQLQTASILYTTGGILDAVNPPSAACQCIHWNRLWIVDDTLTVIWFTKQFTTGEAPAFNEALTVTYPDGGDITAIAGMDDKLVIFKASTISVVYGQGPADNGQGSDLTEPQPIATDAGAIDWRSVCLFPGGLFFQSRVGLCVLNRDLSVTWVGKDVRDLLAQFPTILSSCLVPTATQVRFVCQSPSTLQTVVLAYDYSVQSWVEHQYNFQVSPISSAAFTNATILNQEGYAVPSGWFTFVNADGTVWREQDIQNEFVVYPYEDQDIGGTNHFVPTSVTSGWFKVQGVQGYQRARRVMLYTENGDPSGLSLSIAVNYSPNLVQTGQWADTLLAELPLQQVEMHVAGAYNKQQAIQVTVSDFGGTTAVTGQGARFVAWAVELQSLGERYPRVPVAGRV